MFQARAQVKINPGIQSSCLVDGFQLTLDMRGVFRELGTIWVVFINSSPVDHVANCIPDGELRLEIGWISGILQLMCLTRRKNTVL